MIYLSVDSFYKTFAEQTVLGLQRLEDADDHLNCMKCMRMWTKQVVTLICKTSRR